MVISLAPLWVFLIVLFASATGLKIGARLAGAPASFPRAILAVVIIYPTGIFVTFASALFLTPPVGFFVGLAAVLVIIKVLFSASWPQTIVIWLIMFFTQAILFIAAAILTGLGIQELMRQLDHYLPNHEIEIGLSRFFLRFN